MAKQDLELSQLKDQVTVITWGASPLGFSLTRMALEARSCVAVGVPDEETRRRFLSEFGEVSEEVILVTVIHAYDRDSMKDFGETIRKKFGRVNLWINNFGLIHYDHLLNPDFEGEEEVFDVNFWGTRNGSFEAVSLMRDHGGTLINLGMEVSVASRPLLGIYFSSKAAVKTLTDAIRSELRDQRIPIEVCLVRPRDVETASSAEGFITPQVEEAARVILKCGVKPQRDIFVGGPARLSAILETFFPKVKDIYTESLLKNLKSKEGLPSGVSYDKK